MTRSLIRRSTRPTRRPPGCRDSMEQACAWLVIPNDGLGCFFVWGEDIWVFPKIGGKPPKWMVYFMENPMNKWMIWEYHYFWKHPYIPESPKGVKYLCPKNPPKTDLFGLKFDTLTEGLGILGCPPSQQESPPGLWSIFRIGNPYKPSFATVTGKGDNPRYIA